MKLSTDGVSTTTLFHVFRVSAFASFKLIPMLLSLRIPIFDFVVDYNTVYALFPIIISQCARVFQFGNVYRQLA